MNIPNHISEGLEIFFWLKIFKFVDADPDPGSGNLFDPGSWIWDKHPESAKKLFVYRKERTRVLSMNTGALASTR
jgi:hypothetical protein